MRIRPLPAGLATALLAAAAVLVGGAPAHASTITVNPGQSIQAAVNAAGNGDVIQLTAGTYVENVVIANKYVTLRGDVANPGSVVLNPTTSSASNAVLRIQSVPSTSPNRVLIEGLQISGGNGTTGQAGGITIENNAAPELNRLVITGNQASVGYGGGILMNINADAYIHDSVIRNNSAFRGGAGITAVNGSDPQIVNNVISNNTTAGWVTTAGDGGSAGGAIYLESVFGSPSVRTHPIVRGNTIEDNTASFAGGGIMLRTGVDATIERNTIDGNSAPYGGGIHVETTGSSVTIDGNTISNNTASVSGTFTGSGYGGGVSVYDSAIVSMVRNTVSGNISTEGGAGLAFADSSVITLDANTISGNTTAPAGDADIEEGGGVLVANATITATNNVFEANSADTGGGVNVLDGATATLAFNTFVANLESLAPGGAVFVGSAAVSAKIANNVFADNQNAQIFDYGPKASILNNLFDAAQDYYGTGSGSLQASGLNALGSADGNLDGEPAFADQAGHDFRIGSASAARGLAASGAGIPAVTRDRVGTVRTASPADAGAYTYLSGEPVFADVPSDHTFFANIQWMASTGLSTGTPQPSGKPLYKPADPVSRQAMASFLYRYSGEAFTPPTTATFADVPSESPFYGPIEWMAAQGISTGTPQPSGKPLFNPAAAVSRQSMALFLARFAGVSLPTPTAQSFADVPTTASTAPAIEWMKTAGISTGTAQPSGLPLYKPADAVSRQAMAAFLQRLDDYLS